MECVGWTWVRRPWLPLLLLVAVRLVHVNSVLQACPQQGRNPCGYTAIFSFGDSLADTGNWAFAPEHGLTECIDPPYGMTFFHRPAGRCSDGRLMIDFLAENMGIPYLRPYLVLMQEQLSPQLLQHGVNFAVSGSTALNASFFTDRGIETKTNRSLAVQIQWFKTLLPSLCPHGARDCDELLTSSLFLVGEIGGNDVNSFLTDGGRRGDEVRAVFPMVIKAISAGVQELIHAGARTLVVPGNFPVGCIALYQKLFPATAAPPASRGVDDGYYDPDTGCIRWLNRLVEEYNGLLQEELEQLRRSNPGAAIIYADYYGAALPIFRCPACYGFTNTLEECCGDADTAAITCGSQSAVGVCSNPSQYVSWDGIHMTEAAYKVIAAGLLDGSSTSPTVNGLCPACVAERDFSDQNSNIADL